MSRSSAVLRASARTIALLVTLSAGQLTAAHVRSPAPVEPFGPQSVDWPLYSFDLGNSNFNPYERLINRRSAPYLRRAWSTFNDTAQVPGPPPTGFLLESVLGLVFPAPVVGVIASPILRDGTLYYVDALGTVFARDATTGESMDPGRHWTTTLVDPDFDDSPSPVLPELVYTAPIVTDRFVFVLGSSYGRLHLLERVGGKEIDFDPTTAAVDPFALVPDLLFSSILGDAVIVEDAGRQLLVVGINVILNDALVQGEEGGLQIAFDVSDATQPFEVWRRYTIDVDPATGLRFGSGVSAGSGLAVDPQRGLVIGGTGQNTTVPYPGYPDPALAPPGYVDRSDSLYALDIATGEFAWTNQFHVGDVFNLNAPVSTGPDQPGGPRDADVLAPPVLFSARIDGQLRPLVGDGSKGGLFRAVDRETGATVWERQIAKSTGIGGIQAGASVAGNVVYVAGFEGLDDGFSDAQFGVSLDTGLFANAFFATFSPAFWADVEDVAEDLDAATGMRIKVYALDAASGRSRWQFDDGTDYVALPAGAALRHVSTTRGLVYVTSTSGALFILDARTGAVLFTDQTPDLDQEFALDLGKPHHASMNAGTVISDGMVYVGYGAQNNPSGGIIAYEVNRAPVAKRDRVMVRGTRVATVDVLANDVDPDGDRLRIASVDGQPVASDDRQSDRIQLGFATVVVVNPGDDPGDPGAAYLQIFPTAPLDGPRSFSYTVEDEAPRRRVNGVETDQPEPTHTPRQDRSTVRLDAFGRSRAGDR